MLPLRKNDAGRQKGNMGTRAHHPDAQRAEQHTDQITLLERRIIILSKYIEGIQKWISHSDDKATPLHHIITVERMASLAKAELSGTNKLLELLKKESERK